MTYMNLVKAPQSTIWYQCKTYEIHKTTLTFSIYLSAFQGTEKSFRADIL